jgi:hypothetical protein
MSACGAFGAVVSGPCLDPRSLLPGSRFRPVGPQEKTRPNTGRHRSPVSTDTPHRSPAGPRGAAPGQAGAAPVATGRIVRGYSAPARGAPTPSPAAHACAHNHRPADAALARYRRAANSAAAPSGLAFAVETVTVHGRGAPLVAPELRCWPLFGCSRLCSPVAAVALRAQKNLRLRAAGRSRHPQRLRRPRPRALAAASWPLGIAARVAPGMRRLGSQARARGPARRSLAGARPSRKPPPPAPCGRCPRRSAPPRQNRSGKPAAARAGACGCFRPMLAPAPARPFGWRPSGLSGGPVAAAAGARASCSRRRLRPRCLPRPSGTLRAEKRPPLGQSAAAFRWALRAV